MQYVYQIKSSQTWTCPKSGVYKIITVGGGSCGCYIPSTASVNSINGGTTSFGSFLSAPGGQACPIKLLLTVRQSYGGEGGFDLTKFGGTGEIYIQNSGSSSSAAVTSYPATANGGSLGQTGKGYGAGGGFYTATVYQNYNAYHGSAGEIGLSVQEIKANTQIPVTIGTGGTPPTVTGVDIINNAGRAGIVIVEYLGLYE